MSEHHSTTDPTPEGCFSLDEISAFQSVTGEILADVNYYFWFNVNTPDQRFLYYVEILFQSDNALILSSGEDSEAIRVTDAMSLIQQARTLMERNTGTPAIRQLNASESALWKPLLGKALDGIHLTKNEAGLYDNDAMLLVFDGVQRIIALHPGGGLAIN